MDRGILEAIQFPLLNNNLGEFNLGYDSPYQLTQQESSFLFTSMLFLIMA